jgi:hypothetical protein
MIAGAAQAGEFEDVVDLVGKSSHLERTPIPFFGLGRVVVNIAHPDGIHDVRLATFEKHGGNVKLGDHFSDDVRDVMGKGWNALVSAKSKRDGEQTFIYAREHGKLLRLLIVSNDGDDLSVVQVDLDPKSVDEFIAR